MPAPRGNMIKIYSKITEKLICTYINKKNINEYRSDLSPENELLQGCARRLDKTTRVPPHKHLPVERSTIGTQEAWVVISGKLLAEIYDLDDMLLEKVIIKEGGAIVFLEEGMPLLH